VLASRAAGPIGVMSSGTLPAINHTTYPYGRALRCATMSAGSPLAHLESD